MENESVKHRDPWSTHKLFHVILVVAIASWTHWWHIQTSEDSRFQKIYKFEIVWKHFETQTLKWIFLEVFLGTLRWIPSTVLCFQSLRIAKTWFFPVCFLMWCPAGWIATLERKPAFQPTRHVGMVEGPEGSARNVGIWQVFWRMILEFIRNPLRNWSKRYQTYCNSSRFMGGYDHFCLG